MCELNLRRGSCAVSGPIRRFLPCRRSERCSACCGSAGAETKSSKISTNEAIRTAPTRKGAKRVNRLRRLTPPIPIHSMTCGADRHSDPTPNDIDTSFEREGAGFTAWARATSVQNDIIVS
jgi:hypothetical protein